MVCHINGLRKNHNGKLISCPWEIGRGYVAVVAKPFPPRSEVTLQISEPG